MSPTIGISFSLLLYIFTAVFFLFLFDPQTLKLSLSYLQFIVDIHPSQILNFLFTFICIYYRPPEMENEVEKLDTSCWNGQMFLDNTELLAENIKGIDQGVEEMLQLIARDKDSLLEKVDASDIHKQPELISCIEEISNQHHLLADHYNKITGDLNSTSKSAKENEKRTLDSQVTPPFLTPKNKLRMQDAGSDLSSGGGISDTTPHEGSESYSSPSSDSDSGTYFMSPNEHLGSASSEKIVKRGKVNMGIVEISDYEKELNVCNGKLISAEEEIVKLKRELKKNETIMVKLDSLEAELLSTKNHMKLQESEIEKENEKSSMLQKKIVELEADLDLEKRRHVEELSSRDNRIQKLSSDLIVASGNFDWEKRQLESDVSNLSEKLRFHEAKTEELRVQCALLADEKNKGQTEIVEIGKQLEVLKITWRDDIEGSKVELSEKNALVDTLNQNIEGMKLKYDMVMAEKDVVNAKVETLRDEIRCLKPKLQELQSENKRLSALSESGKKMTGEFESRIVELEKEVMILGEEKREAISQLSFAIDHFRCLYKELRNAIVERKRPRRCAV